MMCVFVCILVCRREDVVVQKRQVLEGQRRKRCILFTTFLGTCMFPLHVTRYDIPTHTHTHNMHTLTAVNVRLQADEDTCPDGQESLLEKISYVRIVV